MKMTIKTTSPAVMKSEIVKELQRLATVYAGQGIMGERKRVTAAKRAQAEALRAAAVHIASIEIDTSGDGQEPMLPLIRW